jgi:isopropylmalate/homocitrate/citramalate synthase
MAEAIIYARERGVEIVEFAGEDASRADVDYVIRWGIAGKKAGGTRMCFSDTVGVLTPEAVDYYFPPLVKALDGLELTAHFHNDYGQAAANTVRALSYGASHAGVTVNGIGERAGNAALHQVVMILKDQYGVHLPNFRYDLLRTVRRRFEEISGIALPPHEPLVGDFVFTHESGIHTAGIAIHPQIYQTINPNDLGTEIRFVFGKHTGRSAVHEVLNRNSNHLARRGVVISNELVDELVDAVKTWRENCIQSYESEIDRYYSTVRGLGLSEEQLVNLVIDKWARANVEIISDPMKTP